MLLLDGTPSDEPEAENTAAAIDNAGINIIAIGHSEGADAVAAAANQTADRVLAAAKAAVEQWNGADMGLGTALSLEMIE